MWGVVEPEEAAAKIEEQRKEAGITEPNIDAYFDYKIGTLEYRSVCFENETLDKPNFQGNAAVNYTDVETLGQELSSISGSSLEKMRMEMIFRRRSSAVNTVPSGNREMSHIIR